MKSRQSASDQVSHSAVVRRSCADVALVYRLAYNGDVVAGSAAGDFQGGPRGCKRSVLALPSLKKQSETLRLRRLADGPFRTEIAFILSRFNMFHELGKKMKESKVSYETADFLNTYL
jgi:hypothetical protein